MLPVLLERSGHCDHEYVGGLHLRRRLEQPPLDHPAHETIEIDFLDMDLAAVDRLDDRFGNVDPRNRAVGARDDRRRRQANIAQTDDTDFRFFLAAHGRSVRYSRAHDG